MINFKANERENFTILEFTLDGPISPSELKTLTLPKIDYKKGVVLSGRGPVWLYGYLVHELHPAAWIATYDPRLGGVVIQSHTPGIAPGDIIEIGEQ